MPIGRLPIDLAILGLSDDKMIVGAHIGKVGVAVRQREDDGFLAVGLDVRDPVKMPLAADLVSAPR